MGMARPAEDVFRLLNRPAHLVDVPFFVEHFRSDERALRDAICSFAIGLPPVERDVLLQCDLGGRSADDVGRQIGLCRRQIQRHRKAARRKFVERVLGSPPVAAELPIVPLSHRDAHFRRRAQIAAAAVRGEPAKLTAARLDISVRTLWRERALMRDGAEGTHDQMERERAINSLLGDTEKLWLSEDYRGCLKAADAALALSRGLHVDTSPAAAALVFRANSWSELIERTVGSPVLADAFFAKACSLLDRCEPDPSSRTLFRVRQLRQHFRDPAGYRWVYETLAASGAALGHPLATLSLAEVYDAWDMDEELFGALRQAATVDDVRAPRHDVARMRIAALASALRPQHEHLARKCIMDVRAWSPPMSRSAVLADAYDAYLGDRNGKLASALARLRAAALHFRKLNLRAETATVLYLIVRLLVERYDPRAASLTIEEALDAANGRGSAKLYADLLQYAALAMGGRQRDRVAKAFAEALTAHSHVALGQTSMRLSR